MKAGALAIDAMGGDFAPQEMVKGAVQAIDSLNADRPFDAMVRDQIAGDLQPSVDGEPPHQRHARLIATGFLRAGPRVQFREKDNPERRHDYLDDVLATLGRGVLGMTVHCARCHDHKYDSITQKEYYQLFAFFNNIDEAGLYPNDTKAVPTPTLMFADKNSGGEQMAGLENQVAQTTSQLHKLWQSRQTAFDEWLSERKTEVSLPDQVAHFPLDRPEEGTYANLLDTESPATSSSANRTIPGKRDQAVLLTGDDAIKTGIGRFTCLCPPALQPHDRQACRSCIGPRQ